MSNSPLEALRQLTQADRGVSEILGLILAFGLVVSVIAVIQLTGAPVWTAGDEAAHNARVSSDLATLDSAVFRTAGFDQSKSVAVETDLSYDNRYISLSPPDSTGTFATSGSETVRLENVVAVGPESAYWNGDTHEFGNATTLRYAPQYTERASQSLVIESGASYLEADGDTVVNRQSLISGTTVNLVILEGDLDGHTTAGETVSLSAVSARTESLPVTGNGAPIRITVPTGLSEAAWGDLLAGEPYASVAATQDGNPNTITIELDGDVTYNIRIARISVGTALEPSDASYLVVEEGEWEAVPATGNQTLVVRAFDEYGAPVAGASVDATADNGSVSLLNGPNVKTDESGRVKLEYTAPDVSTIQPDNVTVRLENTSGPGSTVTIPLEVRGFNESYNVRNADPDDGDDGPVDDDDGGPSDDDDPVDGDDGGPSDDGDDDNPVGDDDFAIDDGAVVPSVDFTGDFELLGSAITDGGGDVPVRVSFVVGNTTYEPDTWENVNDGESRGYNATGSADERIIVIASAEGYVTANSAEDSQQVAVLRNGDPVPDIEGYNGQDDAEAFVSPYISEDGETMELAGNQAIFLFELGSTDPDDDAFDMQDAVILVTLYEDEE